MLRRLELLPPSMLLVLLLMMMAGKLGSVVSAQKQPTTTSTAECSNEGEETRVGFVWYRCRAGRRVPVACALGDGDGRRLAVGQTTSQGNYELRCAIAGDGRSVQLAPSACISADGQRMEPGASASSAHFWYACVQRDDSLSLEVRGCVDGAGNRLPVGSSFRRGSFVFRCSRRGDAVTAVGESCVNSADGSTVPIGGAFVVGDFWYACTSEADGSVRTELKGCVADGRRLNHADKYFRNGFVFQCRLGDSNGRMSVSHAIVGCATVDPTGQNVEHPPGARWLEAGSQPQFKFVMECASQGDQIQKRVVQCAFDSSRGQEFVDAGCARATGSGLLACHRRADGVVEVRLVANGSREQNEQAVRALGLTFC
ncbi:Uncharacterized protein T4D_11706 [Trichinella pseudospiralis]|uniref:Abnormal cell migration protein 18-like fibronectin type I domain-containing protein n=1 Tax=Trichinella pseudospiralis TaxID=6337 RepID=A0A0V1FWG8_TRIPS|nr:Uncharacterized protein T4D_11706 [Trichinella pseudospiralis]